MEPCTTAGSGWCVARRFPGSVPEGQLGFRFGEPLDVDGDGHADVAAGARFKLQEKTLQNGNAAVWSGATGALIREWDGTLPDGLFGHWVLPVPDLDGDARADLLIAAPTARVDGEVRGVLAARSPATGKEIWSRAGPAVENFGWHLEPAGDRDGDGHEDVFVGAPSADSGLVYLVSGKNGAVLRTYAPPVDARSFGFYVAQLDDLDGDGQRDLVVGAPFQENADRAPAGGAWVVSSASGRVIHRWSTSRVLTGFGEMVAAAGDIDGDGRGEIVVASPRPSQQTPRRPGEIRIYSGATGLKLRRWPGRQPGEQFGRMVASAGDLDADGVDDLAVGAPWYARGTEERVGRVELRSARTGRLLAELVGDEADCWFGWHIRRAPDPDGLGRPTLLISSDRHPVDGRTGVGVLDLWVLRPASADQGTITRGARRSDIR
jgi:hypothetical protein